MEPSGQWSGLAKSRRWQARSSLGAPSSPRGLCWLWPVRGVGSLGRPRLPLSKLGLKASHGPRRSETAAE